MKTRLLSVAALELAEAMAWYRARSPRAAERFWLNIHEARHSMALFPKAAPLLAERVRRYIVPGYPYDLIYSELTGEIVILAVAHHSRRPGYWKERLKQVH